MTIDLALLIGFTLLIISLIHLLLQKNNAFKIQTEEFELFKEHYKDVINLDAVIEAKNKELNLLKLEEKNLTSSQANKQAQLEVLKKEISILEENLENISYGLYKPHFDYTNSEEFKEKLEEIRKKQAALIKQNTATYCLTKWTVGNSTKEGEKMVKQSAKMMLRVFNGECDAAIAKVSWNNISTMETRIEKSFEALNKLNSINTISISSDYKNLKLQELRLEFELQEQLYQEKEEQRRVREQMREEEKAARDLEKAQRQAEDDELRYEKALEKAKLEVEKATGKQLDELNLKIKQLQDSLLLAQQEKARAISQAQLTKSGHVYVISNIGSFGENVYKIGMTRRLEPMDRVRELGDASVPFNFDVHAIIYSDNAPELENMLHKKLEEKRVNLVNARREFFYISIDEIENIVKELNLNTSFIKLAEAKEFRESQSLRGLKQQVSNINDVTKVQNQPLSNLGWGKFGKH